MPSGPQDQYQHEITSGIIWHDELQAQVVNEFQRLYQDLSSPRSKKWFFQSPEPAPAGIYIYGSVGRGKTHLMDLFFDTLPSHVGKKRQHYHEFMLWLHHQLRQQGEVKNPLDKVCKQLATETQVLCLDEFLVNDIANAMLLAGTLDAFQRHGISLVTTSNVKPDDLYRDGLQRAKFLPAIDWINLNMKVLHLDGEKDYRQQQDQQHEHWYFPVNESSLLHLQESFALAARDQVIITTDWLINDRPLAVVRRTDQVLWCDFAALCEAPMHASDYLHIADQIQCLILANIPQMDHQDDNAARRFITLIDVMYEHDISVVAQAACHYKMIYQGEKLAFEFERAASRLAELLVSD